VQTIFHSRRGLLRTQKNIKTLAAGDWPQTPLESLQAALVSWWKNAAKTNPLGAYYTTG